MQSLGLNAGLRDILVETLDVAERVDPLFIRFLAYSRLTDELPEDSQETALFLPGYNAAYTETALFPKESKSIARGLRKLAENRNRWKGVENLKEGADAYANYLTVLADQYEERDPQKVKDLEEKTFDAYRLLYETNFPILVIPATTPSVKSPHNDPEMRVCIVYANAEEEKQYERAKNAMEESLDVLNLEKFAQNLRSLQTKRVISLGNFGVNLIFNAAAQEVPEPLSVIYVDEQRLQLDKKFPDFMLKMIDTNGHFSANPTQQVRQFLELMSRMNTILHEYSHAIYPEEYRGELGAKFGNDNARIIDEIKAEIAYRALLPEILATGGLDGTREQWDIAMLASELQMLEDDDGSDDPYFMAARYVLNPLFSRGIVQLDPETKKLTITDYDHYDSVMKEAAKKLLYLHEDPGITPEIASAELKRVCKANELVKEVGEMINSQTEEYENSVTHIEIFNPAEHPWDTIRDEVMDLEKDIFGDDAFDEKTLKESFGDTDNIIILLKDQTGKAIGYS